MATTFNEIYDFFMMDITDHKLITLFNTSSTDFENFLSGWLIQGIPDFTNCDQVLTYANGVFTVTLTQRNINILVLLMKKRWLEKEIDNVLQMNGKIQDRDFKTFSEAQNMTAKQSRYVIMKEEVSQKLVDYKLENSINWSEWFDGSFYIPL